MAFANDKPVNHITWPSGSITGHTRMVVGADTPAELVVFGIQVAMLFYVVDVPTGVEVGYFFVALSNILDFNATNNTCLFGEVVYPTPGDPTSATHSDVKTHFQMTMDDPGTDLASTRFKDFDIIINNTVPELLNNSLLTVFNDETWLRGYTRIRTGSPSNPTNSGIMNFEGDARLQFDGISAGRGLFGYGPSSPTSITINTSGAEQIIAVTAFSYTFKADHIYRVCMRSPATASVAGSRVVSRLRKGAGISGTQLDVTGHHFSNTSTGNANWESYFYVGASDVTTPLTWTGTTAVTTYTVNLADVVMTISDEGIQNDTGMGVILPVLT